MAIFSNSILGTGISTGGNPCSVMMLVGIVVWNVWAFDTVANGGIIGSLATSTAPVFNQSSLDVIHTIFYNRAAEEDKYASGIYSFTDPSQ